MIIPIWAVGLASLVEEVRCLRVLITGEALIRDLDAGEARSRASNTGLATLEKPIWTLGNALLVELEVGSDTRETDISIGLACLAR